MVWYTTERKEMIWFTSDTHFGHKNIIEYSKRPFKDVKEMDQALIDNWNDVVNDGDTVFHLGDIMFSKDYWILDKLKGKKSFIRGNHDSDVMVDEIRKRNFAVRDYYELKYEGRKLILFHYPILSWNGARKGSIQVHGHSHGTVNDLNVGRRRVDVGVDVYNYRPVSVEQIIEEMERNPAVDVRQYPNEM